VRRHLGKTWARDTAGAVLIVALAASPLYALRTNMLKDITRLEELGRYEEALFYRRASMDLILALHVPWAGVPYDPAMDGLYPELDRIYGAGQQRQHQWMETRVDRRYWNIVHHNAPLVTALLKKANLTDAQQKLLDLRVRVYVEDQMAPEFDEMGNFFCQPIARILERTGLFWDASFRRRLTGYYDERVCVPYYAAVAEELAADGQKALAAAYRQKSEWYGREALREFRRSNGDRLLSELQGAKRRDRFTREQVVETLKKGLGSAESDARFAAVLALADLGETSLLRQAAKDEGREVRAEAARLAADDEPPAGLMPGIRAEYFNAPNQQKPATAKILRMVDLGFRGNERFPDVWRPYWEKEDLFPANAGGQFLARFTGKLWIRRDGEYRFYVKTEGDNRAILKLTPASGEATTIISPKNDKLLLYADQRDWGGGTLFRIDFSAPLALKLGLADLQIEYKGGQVRSRIGTAGIRLYWSSDAHVMERVPASALFHEE